MQVQTESANPNYIAGDTKHRLLARDILSGKLENYGLVTKEIEEHYASEWERLNKRALVRSWEEASDAGYALYLRRKEKIEAGGSGPTPRVLDMDASIASEEIERLMRSPSPKDFQSKINELRGVIGLDPIEFDDAYTPAPVILQEGEIASMQPVRVPPTKLENFKGMTWKEQRQVIEGETDTGFIDVVRRDKRIIPPVKLACKKRLLALAQVEAKE